MHEARLTRRSGGEEEDPAEFSRSDGNDLPTMDA